MTVSPVDAAAREAHQALLNVERTLIKHKLYDEGATVATARGDFRRLVSLLAVREAALRRIIFNAESWHGPVPEDDEPGAGHARALAVIATWAHEALAAVPDGPVCHICGKRTDEPGELRCSAGHPVPDGPVSE